MLNPGQRPAWWLSWAALPYALGARLRAYGYQQEWLAQRRLPVPVISVGNLTVGGTGKTPIVIEVTQWLLAAGRRVAVLSRGYRRSSGDSLLLVSDGARILARQDEAGDEPSLIARRCRGAVVAVGADRYRLGRWVLEISEVDCFVLDDGFQHMGLHRDVNLLLLDATDTDGLTQVLPAGRLREPMSAAERATAVVVTRAERATQVEAVMMRLRSAVHRLPLTAQAVFKPTEIVSVTTEAARALEWCRGKSALLVSGLGHPASFQATAEELGLTVVDAVVYPDHHRYTLHDINRLRNRAAQLKTEVLLTTEKDAGKIQPYLTQHDDERWWAIRLSVDWRAGEADLRKMIMETQPSVESRTGA